MKIGIEMKWYCAGLCGVGALTGYFVALSSSPILVNIMPVLLGVVVGLSAYVLGKTNVEKKQELARLKLWGLGFLAFSVSVVFASLLATFAQAALFYEDAIVYDYDGISHQQASDLIAFRRKLKILGASNDEQKRIVDLAISNIKNPEAPLSTYEQYVASMNATAKRLLTSIKQSKTISDIEKDESGLRDLQATLEASIPVIERWIASGDERLSLNMNGIQNLLETVGSVIEEVTGDYQGFRTDSLATLRKDGELLREILHMRASLQFNSGSVYTFSFAQEPARRIQSGFSTDELTKLLISAHEDSTESSGDVEDRIRLFVDNDGPNVGGRNDGNS